MDRRGALKGLGLSLGYLISVPAAIGVLESCSGNEDSWKAVFFNEEEKSMIDQLVDIILPATDTPGGLELNLPQFIDMMCQDTLNGSDKRFFHEGSRLFAGKFEENFGKKITNASKDEMEKQLSEYFDLDQAEQERVVIGQNRKIEELSESEKNDYKIYKFLIGVRNLSLLGYFTSEKIGTEVLNFDPIPGTYLPCIPKTDVGNAYTI